VSLLLLVLKSPPTRASEPRPRPARLRDAPRASPSGLRIESPGLYAQPAAPGKHAPPGRHARPADF